MVRQMSCPICNKLLPATAATESRAFPFCGERCREVDLLRWCKGKYAIVEPIQPHHMNDMLDDLEGLDDGELT